jgi:hypothetical protein
MKSLNLGIETLVGRIKVDDNPTYEQQHSLEKLKLRNPLFQNFFVVIF